MLQEGRGAAPEVITTETLNHCRAATEAVLWIINTLYLDLYQDISPNLHPDPRHFTRLYNKCFKTF